MMVEEEGERFGYGETILSTISTSQGGVVGWNIGVVAQLVEDR